MQHFSIRKLSIGAASVLIGISFLGVKASTVEADSLQNTSETELAKSKAANEVIKQDADSNIKQDDGSNIKQESASKTDAKQVTDNQPNTAQASAKPIAPQPNQQNTVATETKTQVPIKAKLQTNSAITPEEVGHNEVEATTLMATANKKLNTQMLSESKVISQTNDTNGGFDEATWGTLDVNDWQGSVQGDYYQLTRYTGDASHVIVPNEADFAKAGISTSGKQVGVTSDLMKSIRNITYNDGLAFGTNSNQTVAFSKTDNKQIKALNSDWSDTWSDKYLENMSTITQFDGSSLDVSSVTNMRNMFADVENMDLSSLSNWDVSNVTDMGSMFLETGGINLSHLANWNVSKVTNMDSMFSMDIIDDLSPLANWDVSNVTDMRAMFGHIRRISDLSPLAKWKVDNVTDMGQMFAENKIGNLGPLANWNVSNVTNMSGMFDSNQISNLSALANWNVAKVTDMDYMFRANQIGDLSPISGWNVNNVTNMRSMFDDNSGSKTKTATAKRIINFIYPAGYTGKKQDSVTQTVDVPQKVSVTLTTKESKPSNNILDWVTTAEAPEDTATVYFPDYTVPEIKGLLEPDKLIIAGLPPIDITNPDKAVISGIPANIGDPMYVTVTYKLVDSNTNDAFALDPKNGLYEHANVNDNGGYDEDYWGKLNINDWNYTVIGDRIEINGYKGTNSASLIIPNGADFGFINGQDTNNSRVYISSSVMHDLAKNATRIGFSKTANNQVVASDTDWQDAFGGMTNKPGTTDDNVGGGIKYGSPNLTQMDLHNLDTVSITNMSALFNGGSNLTTVGDLSDWNTSNVTTMHNMFTNAANLTNIGNLDNWDTSNVTDMSGMFGTDSDKQSHLTNIGDLSKWKTGNVTDMSYMFTNATNLTNIGNLDNWNTSKVADMSWMFSETASLTNIGNLSKWQTGNVANMSYMFYNATNLSNIGDLSKWQTGNVTNMHSMFYNVMNLKDIGDLSEWQTSNVTDMSHMFTNATNLTNIGDLSKWNTNKVTDMSAMFMGLEALRHLNISNWNLTKLADKDAMKYMFASNYYLTVIANNLTLPAWYQNEINDTDSFWDNHMAVITNVPELIKATGDIDNLKIDDQDASRSIFYDSKGSSDAIKVLTDANNQYIADYNKANPTKFLKLADTVDKNDPITLANAIFVTVPKEFNLTVHFEDVDPNADKDSDAVKQELAKTVELSGNKDDAADLSQIQLPTNFELSGDLPSATFGDTDSVTIQVKHKLSDKLAYQEDNGVASARTDVIAPDGTILITGNVEIRSGINQRQDLVTGQMIDDDTYWSYYANSQTMVPSDILNKYIEQYNPVIMDHHMSMDYTSNSYNTSTEGWQYAIGRDLRQPLQIKLKAGYTVDLQGGPGAWDNWSNNDTYTYIGLQGADDWNTMQQLNNDSVSTFQIVPLDQAVHYQFMDNGTQVGSDVIVAGKTDETVPTNLSIPENYELADGTTLPTSYTFAATNPTIQINLKHKTETSVESLPATRTINVHLPNGTTKVYQQVIGYQRDVITDLVTKTVTRGAWTMNDATSSFTIDGVKQLEQSYVLRNGNYNFASIKLPKVPGYKAVVRTADSPANPARALFTVNFIALPKPVAPAINDVKPVKTITSATTTATEMAELIKTEPKAVTSVAPTVIDLSDDAVTTTPKEATWQVANASEQDTYRVSNGKYTVELPHINNAQLYVIANNSTNDNVLFTYKGQKVQYVFNIKFVDGHYLLTTYEIKSGKLVKVIDYNFVSSAKVSELIRNWLNL